MVSVVITVGATELLGDSLTAADAADQCVTEPWLFLTVTALARNESTSFWVTVYVDELAGEMT